MEVTGDLQKTPLPQLIESICKQRHTGKLTISFSKEPGHFYFSQGELVAGELGPVVGAEAVHQAMIQNEQAFFRFEPGDEVCIERNIHEKWQLVVLQGFLRLKSSAAKQSSPDATSENSKVQTPRPRKPRSPVTPSTMLIARGDWRRIAIAGAVGLLLICTLSVVATISSRQNKKVKASADPLTLPAVSSEPSASGREFGIEPSPDPRVSTSEESPATVVSNIAGADSPASSDSTARMGTRTGQVKAADDTVEIVSVAEPEEAVSKASLEADVAPTVDTSLNNERVEKRQSRTRRPSTIKEESVVVVVDIEGGRVVSADVSDRRRGMEAYEAAALRVARGLRYPAAKTGTERVTLRIRGGN